MKFSNVSKQLTCFLRKIKEKNFLLRNRKPQIEYTSQSHADVKSFYEENIIERDDLNSENIQLSISGVNNTIKIKKNPVMGKVIISIRGDNNYIELNDCSSVMGTLRITCTGMNHFVQVDDLWVNEDFWILIGAETNGHFASNSVVKIGKISIEYLWIWNHHSNSSVVIGDNCMISHTVILMNSDSHPIYDLNTKEIINKPKKGIHIGNHVWIGLNVTIMKDVSIPDGCIIARNSTIATKNFTEPNCIIGGTPGKVLRQNVTWDYSDPNYFL